MCNSQSRIAKKISKVSFDDLNNQKSDYVVAKKSTLEKPARRRLSLTGGRTSHSTGSMTSRDSVLMNALKSQGNLEFSPRSSANLRWQRSSSSVTEEQQADADHKPHSLDVLAAFLSCPNLNEMRKSEKTSLNTNISRPLETAFLYDETYPTGGESSSVIACGKPNALLASLFSK